MQPASKANQHTTRISAHLHPPNFQMEESLGLMHANCQAKGTALGFKVAILGAAGGIGQPLAMLMKINLLISVLHLYDVVNTPGITADISHMDTGAVVRGFLGQQQLEEALVGMDLVIIPAGVPRKPGMTRDDLFNINAGIARTLSEVFKRAGTYDPKRLLGVTMLNVVRANTFVAEVLGLDPREVDVPVVGGHAGMMILPLLSQVKPLCSFTPPEIEYLTSRIQNGGTEVVEAKAGADSATLYMAHAAVKFANACLCMLRGDAGNFEYAFVASQVTELLFFASKVRLGHTGAEEVLLLGPLNEYEGAGLEKAKKELAESIRKGVSFIKK
ncbi:malate dehydrogenase, glyoxysomal-like isoform X3 [Eucalyptus grandis]|uniref:malate dehydrogenase, glyoxysomal-like isoform X3 n=1 Tax=Eucalyptus grandis TaxID=71139 RepID=UPI00192EDA7C|nr:malate dehydrogenase, glyoxysomal-like isoform X3 [Eucalyptus grandis]